MRQRSRQGLHDSNCTACYSLEFTRRRQCLGFISSAATCNPHTCCREVACSQHCAHWLVLASGDRVCVITARHVSFILSTLAIASNQSLLSLNRCGKLYACAQCEPRASPVILPESWPRVALSAPNGKPDPPSMHQRPLLTPVTSSRKPKLIWLLHPVRRQVQPQQTRIQMTRCNQRPKEGKRGKMRPLL